MSSDRQRFDWYLNAILASVTLVLIGLGIILNILALTRGPDIVENVPTYGVAGVTLGFGAPLGVFGTFWFWFRMLGDYFKHRPIKNPVGWGWALFLLNVGAALAYYWFVWRPRNAAKSVPAA